jgi:hypothetical protein
MWLRYLALASLLVLSLTPLVHAGVGLEYLGPNPLRPQPVSGQRNTLQASAIVGNTGDETALVTFTLVANQDFTDHFTYSFSDNNFSLSPGARKGFTLTLTYDNTTPAQDYNASISIVASPASKTGSSGSAAFNLPVAVSAAVVPEFPNGAVLIPLLIAMFAVLVARRGIKSNRDFKKERDR